MNILVFGATGPTGQQVVSQALGRGHRVTAFVRKPDASPIHEGLRIAVGDATRDESKVAEAMVEQDVVISALGRGKSFQSDQLISRAVRVILSSMERAGVRRLLWVSALGVGQSRRDAPMIPRIMYSTLLKDIFADKGKAEESLRRSGLDWTIVYPVLLTDGPLTAKYRFGERVELRGIPKISRADVAHFILDEMENGAFVRKAAVISY